MTKANFNNDDDFNFNNDDTHCECTINYGFTHVSFVRNVAHVRFFSSRTREFLNRVKLTIRENLHLGKITHYTVSSSVLVDTVRA